MSFADGLASDGAEPGDMSVADSSNLERDIGDSESAGNISRGHSRQSSLSRSTFSPSPSLGSLSSSVLGRRQRDFEPQAWSKKEKVHICAFAADKCAEYELSSTERSNVLRDSEVS